MYFNGQEWFVMPMGWDPVTAWRFSPEELNPNAMELQDQIQQLSYETYEHFCRLEWKKGNHIAKGGMTTISSGETGSIIEFQMEVRSPDRFRATGWAFV